MPLRFLSRLSSVFCVLFCLSMFYVSQNQDPRVADKDKVSLQFYLISTKTLTTGQLAGRARTPQPLTGLEPNGVKYRRMGLGRRGVRRGDGHTVQLYSRLYTRCTVHSLSSRTDLMSMLLTKNWRHLPQTPRVHCCSGPRYLEQLHVMFRIWICIFCTKKTQGV